MAEVWFEAATKLFEFFVQKPCAEEESPDFEDLTASLGVDRKFSEARCNKVFPLAVATYQENLPPHYTKKYHETKVTLSRCFTLITRVLSSVLTVKEPLYRLLMLFPCLAYMREARKLTVIFRNWLRNAKSTGKAEDKCAKF